MCKQLYKLKISKPILQFTISLPWSHTSVTVIYNDFLVHLSCSRATIDYSKYIINKYIKYFLLE